jgi:hypothetical protein
VAKSKGPKKTEMVAAALEALGADAKPQEIQAHIQTAFNQSIPTSIISNYKFTLRKKAGAPVARRGRRPAAGGGGGGGGGIRIEDFEAVRGLVGRLGADQVKRIVDVLG